MTDLVTLGMAGNDYSSPASSVADLKFTRWKLYPFFDFERGETRRRTSTAPREPPIFSAAIEVHSATYNLDRARQSRSNHGQFTEAGKLPNVRCMRVSASSGFAYHGCFRMAKGLVYFGSIDSRYYQLPVSYWRHDGGMDNTELRIRVGSKKRVRIL